MQMNGSWHVYRAGERWRRPRPHARVVIDVDGWSAVCFSAPIVELTRNPARATSHLGPDLMTATDDDIDVATRRLLSWRRPTDEIGVVLLDQRVACGVGNAYKSEALFACRVDPFMPVAGIDESAARVLLATASKLLKAGAQNDPAVYGREGQPCRRCSAVIRRRRQGEHARSTYWCPSCQQSHE
jgi:endonuclease-8